MDEKFDKIGKQMPYRVPEGFFERMQAETLRRVEEEKRKKKLFRLKWGLSVILGAAAMLCGFLFFPHPQKETSEAVVANEWLVAINEGQDELDLYIQGLSDDELEDWVQFSENDIYYELTTENLDHDED